jgi:carboxymethylenebutenolidase
MQERPKITNEMINLYNEYTHITLDRRGFMDKLTALAGSSATAIAVTSLIEANNACAQIVKFDDPRLKSQMVKYAGEGAEMTGYLVMPIGTTAKLPAVMIVHENRGLNQHIQDVTRRVALEGFLALAPDFLSELGGTTTDEEKAREMIATLDRSRAIANAVASINYLKDHISSNGKVGAIGFCWGGGVVNVTAVAAGDALKAAAPYYGIQPPPEQVAKIKAAMMLHYAGNDDYINKGIDAYKDALEKAGVNFQIFIYEGTQHAFNNDTSQARYNKASADLAWKRTIDFLKQQLS